MIMAVVMQEIKPVEIRKFLFPNKRSARIAPPEPAKSRNPQRKIPNLDCTAMLDKQAPTRLNAGIKVEIKLAEAEEMPNDPSKKTGVQLVKPSFSIP